MAYFFLFLAIISEVIATVSLKASESFSRPLPSVFVVLGYVIAFYCLTIVLRTMPLAITYAVWSGAGLFLIVFAGAFFYKEIPDFPAVLGMVCIIFGILIIQIYSKTLR